MITLPLLFLASAILKPLSYVKGRFVLVPRYHRIFSVCSFWALITYSTLPCAYVSFKAYICDLLVFTIAPSLCSWLLLPSFTIPKFLNRTFLMFSIRSFLASLVVPPLLVERPFLI